MLLERLDGLLFGGMVQPHIVRLKAHDRCKVTSVGALGLHDLHLTLQAHVFDHVAERFANVLAALFLAFATRADVNHFVWYVESFAHVFV